MDEALVMHTSSTPTSYVALHEATHALREAALTLREAAMASKVAALASHAGPPKGSVSLTFFQAAATIVPLLFLAMLFQARSLHELDPRGRLPLLLFLFWVTVGIASAAEVMGVLARGAGTVTEERTVAGLLLVLLSGVCFGPYWAEIKARKDRLGHGLTVAAYVAWGAVSAGIISLIQARI
jgi:hypothetical protein